MGLKEELIFLNNLKRTRKSSSYTRRLRLKKMNLRECTSCLHIKDLSAFRKQESKCQCLSCLADAYKKYQNLYRNKIQIKQKRYYKNNLNKIKNYHSEHNKTEARKKAIHKYDRNLVGI